MNKIYVPTRIYYGRNITENAISEIDIFAGNILIVSTGRSLIKEGYLEQLKSELKKKNAVDNIYEWYEISGNPDISEIERCVEAYSDKEIEVVVAFGGGSAIDAAKVIAASLKMQISAMTLWEGINSPTDALPIVAMPTTAGTGSELSKAAIVSSRASIEKKGIRGEALIPEYAIVDSRYTESVPKKITAETGFDVLAHAVESYVSKAASEYTRMLSVQAIKTVKDNLTKLMVSTRDEKARLEMSYASMLMGINLGNASTALPHRMQYPLGAHTNTSHGEGLAALFSAWFMHEYDANPMQVKLIGEMLFGKELHDGNEAYCLMREYIKSLGLPSCLQELGVDEELVDVMVGEVSGNLANDPLYTDMTIVKKIYIDALK